jgi:hypothetical protein
MSKTSDMRLAPALAGAARRRPAPLPPMPLTPLAQAGLFGLRLLLAASALMAGFAALHGAHV